MSKELIGLKLKDMYAIKHALEYRVDQRKIYAPLSILASRLNGNFETEKQINKDITHEETLIKKFETEIADFKEKYRL